MAETIDNLVTQKKLQFSKADGFFEALFEKLPLPVCVMNRFGKIIFGNQAFQYLRQNSPQFLNGTILTFRDKQAQLSYVAALEKIVHEQSASEVVFVAEKQSDENLWATLSPSGKDSTVIMTFLSPSLISIGSDTMERRLRTLFGLTAMEAKCALLLARGLSASNIAKQRGVSLPTIRTQLRSIREKMSVQSSLAIAAQVSKLAMPFGEAELRT